MKSRLVVGPPPIKYVKKYGKGGKLPKYQTGGTLANPLTIKDDPWEYAQENGVVYTRKKGADKWINLGSADDMTQLSSRNQIARTAILDKYGKQLGYSQSKIDKETNVLTEPVSNISANDKMVERVKASLATPEGQMKYRPATGKAEVTSSPIDLIAGGAKLGPLLIKTVGKLLIDTAKSQEKGLTKLPENKPSLKTETSVTKRNTDLTRPTSEVSKYSPKGRTYNISGELPSGAKGLGEGMKTVGTGPKLKSGVKGVTDIINKEGKVIKSIYKYLYGGSLPKKQLGGMANVGSTEQAGLGLLTTGLSAIPGVGAILSPIVGALGSAFLGNKQQKDSFNRQYSNIQVAEKGGKIKSDPPVYVYDAPEITVKGKKMSDAEKKFSKSIRENPAKYRPSPGNISPTDSPIEYLLGIKKGLPLALKAASKLKDVDLSQLNPNRYKAKEGYMYRGLDEAGMRDAYQSGVFRAKQKNLGEKKPGEVRLEKQFGEVYFTPKFETAKSYGAKYIAEVPRTSANWKQRYGNKDWSQFTSEIPIQQGKILKKDWWKGYKEMTNPPKMEKGGMVKRKDGSYSRRGLWDNIRANKGSGKKPTKEMLEQERKIKAKMEFGGMLTGKSDLSFYKGRKHANGGIMVSSKGTPSNKPVAEVEGGETRFKLGSNAYIFSDKLTL